MSEIKAEENRIIRKVTVVGAAFDAILGVAKIVVGVIAQSHALVADGIHSFSDLGSDVLVILVSRHKLSMADQNHPYGHDRIQTLAAVVLAVVMFLVAAGIAYDSITRLINGDVLTKPGLLAIVVAVVSILVKEAIYRYTARAATKIQSKLLMANAWHSRSDALSSLVVLIAIVGAIAGLPWADTVGAIIVAGLIAKIAWEIGRDGIDELVDTGLEENQLHEMISVAKAVDGVTDVHDLRTRKMGSSVLADMHIHVAPTISVSEGHRIGDEVYTTLRKGVPQLTDVVIHVDSEDDETQKPSSHLPLRSELESKVRGLLQSCIDDHEIARLVIHYQAGEINLELIFCESVMEKITQDQRLKIVPLISSIENVGHVNVLVELRQ